MEQFKEELENKSEEVQQLNMQLEIQRKEIISQQDYMETRDSFLQVLQNFISDCVLQSLPMIVLVPGWVVRCYTQILQRLCCCFDES